MQIQEAVRQLRPRVQLERPLDKVQNFVSEAAGKLPQEKEINVKEKVEQDVKEPSKYKVIFMNDNETPMDFVVAILTSVFRHSEQTAQELTMKIHNDGQAVVGVYSFEIAEQKAVEATKLSRENGYPLQIAIDKE